MKAEYLLPIYIDELLQAGKVSVKVLDTNDKQFGVTYKEDKDYVVKSFARLIFYMYAYHRKWQIVRTLTKLLFTVAPL